MLAVGRDRDHMKVFGVRRAFSIYKLLRRSFICVPPQQKTERSRTKSLLGSSAKYQTWNGKKYRVICVKSPAACSRVSLFVRLSETLNRFSQSINIDVSDTPTYHLGRACAVPISTTLLPFRGIACWISGRDSNLKSIYLTRVRSRLLPTAPQQRISLLFSIILFYFHYLFYFIFVFICFIFY